MINKIVFRKNKDISYRIIDSQAVILTINDSRLHTLNELGTFIWEMLDGKNAVESIIDNVCEEFDVDKKISDRDVKYFIESLMRRKLISAKGK